MKQREEFDTSSNPRKVKISKKNANVIKKVNPIASQGENSKRSVIDLQNQIQAKESELNAVREVLSRNDTTNINAAQYELHRLQDAFDNVTKTCENRLFPFTQKLQKIQAAYEGRKCAVESLKQSAKERDDSINTMQGRIDKSVSDIEPARYNKVDEVDLIPLVTEASHIQSDIDLILYKKQLNNMKLRSNNHIRESIEKYVNDIKEASERAKKRALGSKENESALIIQNVDISQDWIMAKHKMEKMRIIGEDVKRSIDFLKEKAEKLFENNKRTSEDINRASNELKLLSKYLPNCNHEESPKTGNGVSRSDLTVIEAQKDMLDVLVSKARIKNKITKSTLEKLRSKIAEMPSILSKVASDLSQSKIERENAEESLLRACQQQAELRARLEFTINQKDILKSRIEGFKEELLRVQNGISLGNQKIEQQNTVIKMNDELKSLKTLNFDRFTSTVSNLLNYKNKL